MGKLMNRGYSRQSAFNIMKGLAKKNRTDYKANKFKNSSWIRYLFAIVIELILFFWRVPSKEDVQIMLIQTIIPLSDATKPLSGFVTILAIIMQIVTLLLIYDLFIKIYKFTKKY